MMNCAAHLQTIDQVTGVNISLKIIITGVNVSLNASAPTAETFS